MVDMNCLKPPARILRRGHSSAARNLSFVRGWSVHRVNVHGHDRPADNRFYEQSGSAYVKLPPPPPRERVADLYKDRCEWITTVAIVTDRSFENIRVHSKICILAQVEEDMPTPRCHWLSPCRNYQLNTVAGTRNA